jgi:hypothetical protein
LFVKKCLLYNFPFKPIVKRNESFTDSDFLHVEYLNSHEMHKHGEVVES